VTVEIRYGFTFADLERIARRAARTSRAAWVGDLTARYEEAYGAVAEYLYSTDEPPTEHEILHAALRELADWGASNRSFRGLRPDRPVGAPHFWAYWEDLARNTPSPERRIIETTAVAQIMPMLSPGQREAIIALATHGDRPTAAAALGLSLASFSGRITAARARFRAWWHEGEAPSRPWGRDRGIDSSGGVMRTVRRRKYHAARAGASS